MKVQKKETIALLFILWAAILITAGCTASSDETDDSTPAGTTDNCTAAQLEYKPVDFHNNGTTNVTVRVAEYDLDCSSITFQDPSDVAFALGSPGIDPDAHLLLPQGSYSVCIDWWSTHDSTYYHKFYGDLPNDVLFSLNENSNEVVPPSITVAAGFPIDGIGQCPTPVPTVGTTTGSTPDSGNGDSGGGSSGSSPNIDIALIGNYGETAIYNPTNQEIQDADITLSGSRTALIIDWKLRKVLQVQVAGTGKVVYAITGKDDGSGGYYTITGPITYGDYSVPNTDNSGTKAPSLQAGEYYTVTIATEDKKTAYVGFYIY